MSVNLEDYKKYINPVLSPGGIGIAEFENFPELLESKLKNGFMIICDTESYGYGYGDITMKELCKITETGKFVILHKSNIDLLKTDCDMNYGTSKNLCIGKLKQILY